MKSNLLTAIGHSFAKSVKAITFLFFILLAASVWGQKKYTLVTSAADLNSGSKYLIVNGNSAGTRQALSTANTNNRSETDISVVSVSGVMTITTTPSSSASDTAPFEITLGGSAGAWTLLDAANGNNFLRASSSSNNNLNTGAVTANWTISFSSTAAVMTCITGNFSRNILRYNSSASLFSCYSTGQAAVYLYKEVVAATPTLTITPASMSGLNYVQGSGPSAPQSYNLKGIDLTAGVTVAAPTNFEVSKSSATNYGASISYTITEGNAVAGQTVYVRLKSGLSANNYTGSVTNVSTGALQKNVTVAGMVTSPAAYNLTYNGNGNDTGTVPAVQTGATSYTVAGNPNNLMRFGGYYWMGWTLNADGSGTAYGPGHPDLTPSIGPLTANTILYARYVYTIIYIGNGNSAGPAPAQQINYNSLPTSVSGAGSLVRDGYTFSGWNTAADGSGISYSAGSSFVPATGIGITQLHAQWIPNTPTFHVSPASLSGFNFLESYGPSSAQSFVFTATHLYNTASDPVELKIINDHFEISENTSGPWSGALQLPSSYSGTEKTIFVRLKAAKLTGNYSDQVLISGGGTVEASFGKVNLSGTVSACLAPVNQASVSSIVSVTASGMTINLNSGNGMGRIIKINTSNSFDNPASSNNLPVANAVYSGGEQVVFAGAGNTVSVTGLLPSTTYYFRVYEYNICSGNYIYNTNTVVNNPRSQMTLCYIPVNPNGEVDVENPYCGSASIVYQHGANQPQSGVTYYWQTNASGTSTANPVTSPYVVTASGDYYVRAYNGYCWSAGSFKTNTSVVISTAAGIATQPNNQNVAVGATASFAVTASGSSPFSYQWQESSTGLSGSWVNVGTSINSFSVTDAQLSKNGYKYRVIVSNQCNSKTSDVVTLSVNLEPVSIWKNDIEGTNPNTSNPYTVDDNKNANIVVSGIGRGAGITGNAANNRYNATGWTATASLDTTDYFEFTLMPNANYAIDLSSFVYTGQRSNSGPSNFAFRSSADNFLTDIGTVTPTGTTVSLASAAYQNITSPITFRFYGWSSAGGTFSINDFNFTGNVVASCTPAAISSFPTSGPVNTVVTITGSGFTAESSVKFGNVGASSEFINDTQLKVVVPSGANGNIIVDTSLACDSETVFTLINSDLTNCELSSGGGSSGSLPSTDLIIYEVYDENTGSGGFVSIYNGTSSTISLNNYNLYRSGGESGDTYSNYATLSGSIAPGAVGVVGVNTTVGCRYASTNGNLTGGFNEKDGFQLIKNAGATILDEVIAPNYKGYYLKRKNTNLTPASTYNESQWTTESLNADQCLPASQVAQSPGLKTAPVIVTQPLYSLACDVSETSLSITATEGLAGGNGLVYQWYVLGTSGTWAAITDSNVYTGATSQTLNINNINNLINYQYYCQVRENTATCYSATNAAQIKDANNIWSANVWSNGTPILGSNVIIAGSYDTQANGALDVCELTVNSTGTVIVKAENPIKVKKKITNNNPSVSSFVVESDANLIQIDNIANEGDIKVERSVTGMNNSGSIDYVYWSSPVAGQSIKDFSPGTPGNGFQEYNESNDRFVVTTDPNFVSGKGYAIRAENVLPNGYDKVYNFTGVPNNGNISSPLLNKSGADKGYNLVGNPYPSNIDFDSFHALNSSRIYASAFFWTNNTYTAQQMGSGYTGNNYAIYNITGGLPATYDLENPNYGTAPNGKIKVGQAFIVQSKVAGVLDFRNNMRVTEDGTFYQKKTAKNRFWLTMLSPKNMVNTILVGYIPGATNNFETDFDGELFSVGSDSFYSIVGVKKLGIQGRSNNFSTDDKITIGNVYSQNGSYTISLKQAEGIFEETQNVYLKDKLLNKIINLNTGDYTFQAVKGTNITRFEIVYKDAVLTTDDVVKSDFTVYTDGSEYVVTSSKVLGKIEVYDTSGRLVISQKTNNKILRLNAASLNSGIYIIKAENSGDVRTKKVVK